MKTKGLNTGGDWGDLQETIDSLIVLDSNDLIVSCNYKAQKTLLGSYSGEKVTLPVDCFWSESDQRRFAVSEFKHIAGKAISLLLQPKHTGAYKVKVFVEKMSLLGSLYYSLIIREEKDAFLDVETEHSRYDRLVDALRFDLKDQRLSVHYQPQVDTLEGCLYGVEVLARWHSDLFGWVSPDEFVSVAEEAGLIAELDLYVLRQACQQWAIWRKKGVLLPLIAVNFSPLSFALPQIEQIIYSILEEFDVPFSSLVIEVTENKKIIPTGPFISIICELYSVGVNISLDDFGTGYSNFKRLLKFPVSQLKLDRVFVNELPSDMSKEISETVFSISRKIGVTSVAEGIETEQQLIQLKNMGYRIFQGYLFSPPLSDMDFESWLADFRVNN
ncbi:EAL domain-containing protein [Marinomonas sp. M1K-6]|uniref:EAL domain-containing protein n=1 Tax=Marinomonas profundi TaxID=2726122 RepID=A0A847QWQ8_9GAMM|nr:EAL domain-containing protein [Marinomonas profundi]NLQ16639.1 EAL domain-containing protein [Marinomonas profundi]UDV03780.1 EAL domain-containing protein [Marinomonas profundi]